MAKFKIGDKVKAKQETPYSITTKGYEGTITKVLDSTRGTDDIKVDDFSVESKYFDLISSKILMTKLNSMMKRLLDAQTKKLIKGGLIDGDLKLTEEGGGALAAIEFEEHKAELVKIAEENIKEAKKDC